MLDIYRLSAQINEKKEVLEKNNKELKTQIGNIISFLNSADKEKIQNVLAKIPRKDEKNEILFCLPYYSNYNEFLNPKRCLLNTQYQVFAVDGSNTEIDRHIQIPYYILNIACIFIEYNEKDSKFEYQTFPYIYFDQEIYSSKDEATIKNSSEISQERQQKEFEIILEYIENSSNQTDKLKIVLYDGNLIDWTQDRQNIRFGRKANSSLEKIFLLAEQKEIAICGFISYPKNAIISNIYRIFTCEKTKIGCRECERERKRECEKVGRIRDIILFSKLGKGEHSQVFYTLGRAFDEFEKTDIGFVYLNTGYEIARIEFPLYIANNKEWLENVIGAIYHQCQLGFGYPISLTHAHEFSVISKDDRIVVETLMSGFEDNIVHYSAKKNNKIQKIV
ncbi:NurA domain protein [Caldicellulosiruptor owensensis OL]|uniref:NurA domain protein n=1 Tax=Caldicellulosiruptor owensensis (strain ATCC 700167 / DSM 13100 / OL) TaxID=632518 RepID=E4Q6T4_CALOW|nr:DNA double-strand break repair nuclease NurA [Caldicellulosiruptor owensensis]ADQ04517.1 NurA domain protein [Caldicellulosiruptor owensensis OL]